MVVVVVDDFETVRFVSAIVPVVVVSYVVVVFVGPIVVFVGWADVVVVAVDVVLVLVVLVIADDVGVVYRISGLECQMVVCSAEGDSASVVAPAHRDPIDWLQFDVLFVKAVAIAHLCHYPFASMCGQHMQDPRLAEQVPVLAMYAINSVQCFP